jgi:peptidoglycan/LPS O-acetylase OafA/YrhL
VGGSRQLVVERRWAGIDAARLVGLALIYVTHALSITGNDALATFHGVRFGRIGTALFLIVGGYMAAVTTRSPEEWLFKRLKALLPAYWIVLAPTFLAAWVIGYKSFDAWQVISQFLGLGFFTHGDQLVNVTTWFVSAILLLYVVAYLAKRIGEIAVITTAVVLAFAISDGMQIPTLRWMSYCSVFLAAYLLPHNPRYLPLVSVVVGCVYLGLYLGLNNGNLRYAGIAFFAFAAVSLWRLPWKPIEPFANVTYEWFLVHGPALHVAKILTGGAFWPVFLTGIAIASVGVIVLRQTVPWTGALVSSGVHFAIPGNWAWYLALRRTDERFGQSSAASASARKRTEPETCGQA